MKRTTLAAFCLTLLLPCATALAADAAPPKASPACGKTTEECQTKLDAANTTVAQLTAAFKRVVAQRDAALQEQINDAVASAK